MTNHGESRRARRERDQKRSADDSRGGSEKARRPRQQMPGLELAQQARDQLAEITGHRPEGVTSLEQQDDGRWIVTVELLELSRVPETDDVLGSYETEVDERGDLLGYRRVSRYPRSQAGAQHALRGG